MMANNNWNTSFFHLSLLSYCVPFGVHLKLAGEVKDNSVNNSHLLRKSQTRHAFKCLVFTMLPLDGKLVTTQTLRDAHLKSTNFDTLQMFFIVQLFYYSLIYFLCSFFLLFFLSLFSFSFISTIWEIAHYQHIWCLSKADASTPQNIDRN